MSAGPDPLSRRSEEERELARQERLARRSGMRSVPPPRPVARRRRIFLVVLLVLLAALVWFLWSLFQPFHGSGSGRVAVTIPRQSGVGDIASLLEKRGVISSSFFFEARTTLAGKRGDLKPGSYELKRDMSYSAVLGALTKGPPNNIVTIVVPEGRKFTDTQIRALTEFQEQWFKSLIWRR